MKGGILIACEESQAVTIEFRKLGYEAYSCDLLDCSGGHPEWHLKQDVLPLLKETWELIIAFPPCIHLASVGAAWWKEKQADGRQQQAIDFFMKFINADCKYIAVENPIGIMSSVYRKPDQYIQPYEFGHPFTKKTCLWLKGLPKLVPTQVIDPKYYWVSCGTSYQEGAKLSPAKSKRSSIDRSKTFQGIAKAMAEQWSKVL